MWTSFSMMVGGGVRIRDDGIGHIIITPVGPTISNHPLFIKRYPDIGGMITGSISGKDINGTLSEEITKKFRKTGTIGKRINIGRKTTIGAFKKSNTTSTNNEKRMI